METKASRFVVIVLNVLLIGVIAATIAVYGQSTSQTAVLAQAVPTDTPGPSGGGGTTNNYYGINCGDSATPCHVIIDNTVGITLPLPLAIATIGPVPVTSTVSIPVTFAMPIAITATLPISTVNYPRPIGEGDTLVITSLLAVILLKIVLVIAFNIPRGRQRSFDSLYDLILTALFIVIDIYVAYPLIDRSQVQNVLSYTPFAITFAVWVFAIVMHDVLDAVSSLTHTG